MNEVKENINSQIDELEAFMFQNIDPIDCPLKHRFVPGMYIREIFMPKDSIITSLIHKTTHPYFILQGEVSVFSENNGVEKLKAPHVGITTPNTRRVLYIEQDCVWATVHKTDIKPENDSDEAVAEAVCKIADEIIDWRENTLLGGSLLNGSLIKPVNNIVEQ